jgi:bifunctional UDP-N-acetylglucosamine pyrophosphorylase/glucosamine-1-phosphate N-acetyltransferase
MDVHIVILAAGKGTRMHSALPKVLHRAGGLSLIEHVLRTADALQPRSTTVVVGHQADALREALLRHSKLKLVVQEPQLGTGHAVLQVESALRHASGTLVVLSGDVPLLTTSTLKDLVQHHVTSGSSMTVLTMVIENPSGYGRIVRGGESGDQLASIVEERDTSPQQRLIREVNSGIYAFALDGLFEAIRRIGTENAQGEYYLPEAVSVLRKAGRRVEAIPTPNSDEVRGINTRAELAAVNRIMRDEKNAALMASGVTLEDPATAYIDRDVTIGPDTIIHPGVSIEGSTTIGSGCEIHSGVRIVNSEVGDRVTILNHCVLVESRVAAEARIGPFANLRKDSDVREKAHVGNFVELKNTVLGPGSKANHLSYLGDTRLGEQVNVGAGTITCNYDGEQKRQTIIEDGAFIGSDSQLVAPVTIGKNAYVGTGTTIRENVPADALAVSAGKQRNIENWVTERKKKQRARTAEVSTLNAQEKS